LPLARCGLSLAVDCSSLAPSGICVADRPDAAIAAMICAVVVAVGAEGGKNQVFMATHLLTGDNESILRTAVSDLVHELVGDGERSMMVDEFDGEEYELRLVVDAAQTMPFLTDKRVVVARQVSRFNADDLVPLLAYVENPLDSSDLVLVAGGTGRLSKKLSDAVKAVGKVHNTSPGRDNRKWLADQVSTAGLKMDQRSDRTARYVARRGRWSARRNPCDAQEHLRRW